MQITAQRLYWKKQICYLINMCGKKSYFIHYKFIGEDHQINVNVYSRFSCYLFFCSALEHLY